MLACIACSKEAGDGSSRSAASKSLTSQLKDMVLKFSGVSNPKPKSTFTNHSYRHNRTGSFDVSTAVPPAGSFSYLHGTTTASSSSSTPAWDFSNFNSDPRFNKGNNNWESDEPANQMDGEPKEWMAQIEPGVQITFVSLPGGAGNDLKRIRFSREMFNKWQAQRWWGENYDRIVELYNVQRFSRQGLPTPPASEDGQRESFYSRAGSTRESPLITSPLTHNPISHTNTQNRPSSTASCTGKSGLYYIPSGSVPDPTDHIFNHHFNPNQINNNININNGINNVLDAGSRATTSSRDEVSISNASELDVTEWIEEDQPGVYVTIRELGDGARELRRIRFSREKFGEERAKLWWEENRERIQAQYL